MVKAVVGANWGDEGKGKITDMLADSADVVIRFQGGANAGHTIVNNYGKFALHTLPSGVFHQNVMNIIGNGVALNIPILFRELQEIESRGVPAPQLMISDRCQIVMPYHILFDQLEEERLAGKSFGSTKSGIAPFYSDKFAKIGFQVNELFQDEEVLAEKIADVCVEKDVLLVHLYGKEPIDRKALLAELVSYRDMVAPYVGNVAEYLERAVKEDKTILLEGQLGTPGGPARNNEGPRPRHLSYGHFLQHAGCLWRDRRRDPALRDREDRRRQQGIFLGSRRGRVHLRDLRR